MNQQKDQKPVLAIPVSFPPFSDFTNLHIDYSKENILESASTSNLSNVSSVSSNAHLNSNASNSKSSSRWTSSEIHILIEEVGKNQKALQQVRDPRHKERIWDKIVSNIQGYTTASTALKECSKTSIQQKWKSLHQKYRSIKDTIKNTGEEAVQTEWEFFNDMEEFLKNNPSISAPVTSDSISGIKRKQNN
ncbi:19874_t:CDS:2 [Cetraspora pellucida]|uniref:19874_t:CDS:1 n=1 Tax=Cetraspora pellucida TaxID=1433469 RepID=A0A9N9JRD6_9GLOM|nr:19874_t:CDS:2 [Cetraspora pellucida]